MYFRVMSHKEREAVIEYIKGLPEGRRFDIHVNVFRKKRTIPQNRLYRLWLNSISESTGEDPDKLHDFFKWRFLAPESTNVLGMDYQPTPTTKTLNTEEFSAYMERIRAFVIEFDPTIPLFYPDDKMWDWFEDTYSNYLYGKI